MDRRGGGLAPREKEHQQPGRHQREDARDEPAGLRAAAARGRARLDARARALGNPAELSADVAGALPALVGILREAGLDDPVESGRRRGLDRRDRRRLGVQDRSDERRLARAGERPLPCRHLVEHGAEGEDVRSRVRLLALELFGRHVLQRPQDRPFLRQRRSRRRQRGDEQGVRFRLRPAQLRQAEVEELHARLRQHHVAGLQVPVHDPMPMRLVQRVGDLDAVAQRLLERERPLHEPVRERLAFEVLHDQVLDAVLIADVVERADVRMGELRDRLRLPLEALAASADEDRCGGRTLMATVRSSRVSRAL